MSVRPVGSSEADQLLALCRAFVYDLGRGRGGLRFIVDVCELFNCDAASLPGRLAEQAQRGLTHSDEALLSVAFVFDGVGFIYVASGVRQQGRGRSLFHALRAAQGSFELWTKPGDRVAKSCGESVGLKARKLVMSEQQGEDDGES